MTSEYYVEVRDSSGNVIASHSQIGPDDPILRAVRDKDSRHSTAVHTYDPAAVRRWARVSGIEVSDTGRLPDAAVLGYLASQPGRAVARTDAQHARAWALEQGLTTARRGKVAWSIMDQWRKEGSPRGA